jgi:hypothetical protein
VIGHFHQPLVYFTTATDSVTWIQPDTGESFSLAQTGARGTGVVNEDGWASVSVGIDVPETSVPEPGTLALLSTGLLWCVRFIREETRAWARRSVETLN